MGLHLRVIGAGPPVLVLHGGPDFDHTYLRPELDRLAGSCRLVYYDQRGRGRSAAGVRAADVGIDTEVEDIDRIRRQLGAQTIALLGHSWGGLLAMEYACRHPRRVSHLVLLNSAPASAADWAGFRRQLHAKRPAEDAEHMQAIGNTASYAAGDLQAELDYYRIHFRTAVRSPAQLELILTRLRAHFTPDTVLLARAIEQRLYEQTCLRDGYDLLPGLTATDVPTLVLHGRDDFVPVEYAAHIADAIPGARLVVVPGSGHFCYLDEPDLVHQHVAALLSEPRAARS
jgi:proline-specific peptidase